MNRSLIALLSLVLAVTILLFADIALFRRPIEVMPDLPRHQSS